MNMSSFLFIYVCEDIFVDMHTHTDIYIDIYVYIYIYIYIRCPLKILLYQKLKTYGHFKFFSCLLHGLLFFLTKRIGSISSMIYFFLTKRIGPISIIYAYLLFYR